MKLTLRELFWLVLVCGLAVGWWVEKQQRTAIQEVQQSLALQLAQERATSQTQIQLLKRQLDNEIEIGRRSKWDWLPYVPETGIDG